MMFSTNRKRKGVVALAFAALLMLGAAAPAQAVYYDFGSNSPVLNCNGTPKFFKTTRHTTKADVYFKLTKAGTSYHSLTGLSYDNWWGVTIYGNSDWNYMAGAPNSAYVMTNFLKNTPFKMNGMMRKQVSGSSCSPSWKGSIDY